MKNNTSKSVIFIGWVIITLTYFLTLAFSHILYRFVFQTPADFNWNTSGTFIGIFMLTVPYIVGGLFVRKTTIKPMLKAFWVSIVPTLSKNFYYFG
jgi:hypothetical protein